MNIASLEFVESISCDKPVSNFAPLSNLFTANRTEHFAVESFVRTPVSVQIQFKRPLSILALDIGLRCNSSAVQCLQIFMGADRVDGLLKHFGTFRFDRSVDSAFLFDGSEFADKILRRSDELKCSVCSSVGGCQSCESSCHHESFHTAGNYRLLRSCGALIVRIIQCTNFPCLSYLRIYSDSFQPEKPLLSAADCRSRQVSVPSPKEDTASMKDQVSSSNARAVAQNDASSAKIDIPDSFLDRLTGEVMTLPVLLPCGVCIDRSSLEKYLERERAWGRLPNDPFTALKFSEGHRPLPNVPLKLQIDRFLNENPNAAKNANAGRTLCATFSVDLPSNNFAPSLPDEGNRVTLVNDYPTRHDDRSSTGSFLKGLRTFL